MSGKMSTSRSGSRTRVAGPDGTNTIDVAASTGNDVVSLETVRIVGRLVYNPKLHHGQVLPDEYDLDGEGNLVERDTSWVCLTVTDSATGLRCDLFVFGPTLVAAAMRLRKDCVIEAIVDPSRDTERPVTLKSGEKVGIPQHVVVSLIERGDSQ